MKKLKSERHHWWPECVSQHWAADDGTTGWLKPDGSCVRTRPANLGVIGNGHHIKMKRGDEPTPWDQSFERVFDKADSQFPKLITWLEGLEHRPMHDVMELKQRFIAQPCTDDELLRMTECAVSLAVRGPMNREASVALAEHLRGPIESGERNRLIGLNMRNAQRTIADSIGARGKFVVVYSQDKEFIFGDGFFHNVGNAQMAPHSPKLFVPITPNICVLVCRPSGYMVEPRLSTLVANDNEVNLCNDTIQVYSKNAIYFRSQQPIPHESFRCAQHLSYEHPGNPINNLIHSIPGVSARDSSFDHFYNREACSDPV
ncbi:DUF4238 domain-containing protein [Pollutimonas bauzanensis]|nr:DUF4238 domain-containing protein [Pollutimonas bauzanensis]